MSKSCLYKLPGNVLVGCALPIHGITDLYLMHVEDVTFTYSTSQTQILTADFAVGAKSYRVEGYKQNIQVTAALRSTDVSGRFDVSIMFKAPLSGAFARSIMAGKFYVMTVEPATTGANFVWGCSAPLECSNVEYDSNANGKLITYTLTAPEGSAGNSAVLTHPDVTTSIIAKSV
jgi:hypothetical protein